MSQEAFIRDVLKTWEMTNCRPVMVPGSPTTVELPEEKEPDPAETKRVQRKTCTQELPSLSEAPALLQEHIQKFPRLPASRPSLTNRGRKNNVSRCPR